VIVFSLLLGEGLCDALRRLAGVADQFPAALHWVVHWLVANGAWQRGHAADFHVDDTMLMTAGGKLSTKRRMLSCVMTVQPPNFRASSAPQAISS
jgi:hypothetical protein